MKDVGNFNVMLSVVCLRTRAVVEAREIVLQTVNKFVN